MKQIADTLVFRRPASDAWNILANEQSRHRICLLLRNMLLEFGHCILENIMILSY